MSCKGLYCPIEGKKRLIKKGLTEEKAVEIANNVRKIIADLVKKYETIQS